MMKNRIRPQQAILFAVPVLLLLANAQFAFVSYRHAHTAHIEAVNAARSGDTNGMRFWKAMEAEEGGEYADSINFGLGFLFGISLVGGLAVWNLSLRQRRAPG